MKITILGNPDGWYVHEIVRAATEHSHSVTVATWNDLQSSSMDQKIASESQIADSRAVSADGLRNNYDSHPVTLAGPGQPDVLIVRNMPLGSLEQTIFRMNALAAIERSGVRVINAPRCLEICIDKWLTLELLTRSKIKTPDTIVCQNRAAAFEAWERFNRDCVVKPVFGGEGRGIIRVDDPDLAWRVFSAIEQTHSVLYLQRFVKDITLDARLLLIGESVFAVERFNQSDWRSNASRGGSMQSFQPTDQQIDLARSAAACVSGYFVGVDLLGSEQTGDMVLEINAVPGWKTLQQTLGVDIANELIRTLT